MEGGEKQSTQHFRAGRGDVGHVDGKVEKKGLEVEKNWLVCKMQKIL